MKNIYDVLRQKELLSEQLQKEIEALRLAIKILDEADGTPTFSKPDIRLNANSNNESAPLAAASPSKRFP